VQVGVFPEAAMRCPILLKAWFARHDALGALSVLIESEPKLQILVLTCFLPQISLRNLRKLDCYANRYPLRSKTL
jgi:hypothetical protein